MNYTLLVTFTLVFGVSYTQASAPKIDDSKTLVQNILEDNALSNDEKGYDAISLLSRQKIGTEIMKDHPIVQFIMKRVIILFTNFVGHKDTVHSAIFNRSGDKVLTCSGDKTAKIWNAQTGDCLVTLEGHSKWVHSARFSRSGDKVLTTPGDKTAKIWNAQTGDCLVTLEGHNDYVNSAVFNSSTDKVLTASDDKTAKIWDISVFVKLKEFFSQAETIKKRVTLKQALILDAIYETIISREWAQKYPEKFYAVNKDGQKITHVPISQVIENMRFDFNKYTHLQEDYEDLPQEIQTVLDPYVKKTGQTNEASTSSTQV